MTNVDELQLLHNPRCSKSRRALELLNGRGTQPEVRRYLDDDRLLIHGQMDHAAVMREIRSAAFTVIPSTWENWNRSSGCSTSRPRA